MISVMVISREREYGPGIVWFRTRWVLRFM